MDHTLSPFAVHNQIRQPVAAAGLQPNLTLLDSTRIGHFIRVLFRAMHQVDILLPVRTPAPWLPQTLSSLLDQTYSEWNLVCSVPKDSAHLKDVIIDYVPTATLIDIPDDLSFPETLNEGTIHCHGEYLFRLDQDDIAFPTRIQEQVRLLRDNPSVAMVCSPVILIDELGNRYGDAFRVPTEQLPRKMLMRNCIAHPTVAIRRSILSDRPYDTRATNGEDYELWLRLLAKHEFVVMPDPVISYRRHPGQMSSTTAMNAKGRKLIRRRRCELARARGLPLVQVLLGNLLWSPLQILRTLRRRSK